MSHNSFPQTKVKPAIGQFFRTVDVAALVGVVSSVVRSVEILFSGPSSRSGRGSRKKARALRQILRMVDPDNTANTEVVTLITTLIDIFGARPGERSRVDRVADVILAVRRNIDLAREFMPDDAGVRSVVIEAVNGELDIPGLDEAEEAVFLGLVVDAALGTAHLGRQTLEAPLPEVGHAI